eukprot:1473726-Prymnesium_polylepis.1
MPCDRKRIPVNPAATTFCVRALRERKTQDPFAVVCKRRAYIRIWPPPPTTTDSGASRRPSLRRSRAASVPSATGRSPHTTAQHCRQPDRPRRRGRDAPGDAGQGGACRRGRD